MDLDRDTAPQSAPEAPPPAKPEDSDGRVPSRRKLFKLAATAAPVIVAMGSRPAWACNLISPSAYSSTINAAHGVVSVHPVKGGAPPQGGYGCSYWQKCFNPKSEHNPNPMQWQPCPTGYFQGTYCPTAKTTFSQCLGGSNKNPYGYVTCNGNSWDQMFAAHYLNAQNISGYPCSIADLKAMYAKNFTTGGYKWTTTDITNYLNGLLADTQPSPPSYWDTYWG